MCDLEMMSVFKEMLSPLSKDTPMAVHPCLRASDTRVDKLEVSKEEINIAIKLHVNEVVVIV